MELHHPINPHQETRDHSVYTPLDPLHLHLRGTFPIHLLVDHLYDLHYAIHAVDHSLALYSNNSLMLVPLLLVADCGWR